MTQKKPTLGRGLADLLGASKARAATPAAAVPITPPAASGAAPAAATPAAPAAQSTAAPPAAAVPRDEELARLPVAALTRGK